MKENVIFQDGKRVKPMYIGARKMVSCRRMLLPPSLAIIALTKLAISRISKRRKQ